ncbi:MAG: bifunctional phosphopantothenoylcysteine decarboxylase/phosphopantothenate--cysteine ligase CoaBC [Bacteroidetes bacterium]|nr:bifunctional phosphopantothenoylcysteine decarboxylase/phosphopantothenate--cysteine ligase CoaBC [Bacteroidota bacterium]
MIKNKKILIGVSGSIAAYKVPLLVRLLKKAGAEVKVVLTPSAKDFVTPITLSTLSENPVHSEFVLNEEGEWVNHVELALWADLFIIAPATANSIAKMTQGICDNLLLAVYLSSKCPVAFAPAMDLDMFKHDATLSNIEVLKERGNLYIPPGTGQLASGLEGEGRLAEPQEIFDFVDSYFEQLAPLKEIKALITAGPTYEALDPVRFIGNHSTGKMGYELALRLAELGAEVILILGPTQLLVSQLANYPKVTIIRVTSSDQMYEAALKYWPQCQLGILAAAVADYKPSEIATQKIKKKDDTFQIDLVKTKDILQSLGQSKKDNQFLVGFALETHDELNHAKNKLASKNLNAIILNSLNDAGAGFGGDTNKVTIIGHDNKELNLALMSKRETAIKIIDYISQQIITPKEQTTI